MKGGGYILKNGILYKANKQGQEEDSCVVVPTKHREAIMQIVHDSIMGSHLGYKRTLDKIRAQFNWPGITADVERYCKSCDACQRTIPKGKVQKAPVGSMLIIETPLHRVAVDLIGPIDLFKEVWDGALLFWKMADKLRRGSPFALQTLKRCCSGRRNTTITEIKSS